MPYIQYLVARGDQARFQFAAATEPEGGVRGNHGAVRPEAVGVAERNERKAHAGDLTTALYRSGSRNIEADPGRAGRPLLPGPAIGTPGLEREVAVRAKGHGYAPESPRPILIGEENLRHVSGHHREISTGRRRGPGIAMNPGDPPGCILGLRDVKGCSGRVDSYDRAAAVSEQDGQASRPAADIKDTICVQLIGNAEIGNQVIAVSVKVVIDGCEPRMSKDRIWHAATISAMGSPGCAGSVINQVGRADRRGEGVGVGVIVFTTT